MLPAIILNKEAISKHSIFSFPCFKKYIYNSLFIYKIQFHYWFMEKVIVQFDFTVAYQNYSPHISNSSEYVILPFWFEAFQ